MPQKFGTICNDQTFLSNNDPKSLSESTIFYGQFLASKANFQDSDKNVDFLEEKGTRIMIDKFFSQLEWLVLDSRL